MEQLVEINNRLLSSINTKFIRSLYSKIQWNNRLIEIRGARGVGKTTMMLQRAKELRALNKNVLYISADNAYFYTNKITEIADKFYKYGGIYLFIDEVHKYPKKDKGLDWSQEIKNIYDSYPNLFIVYSGSSILQLYKGAGDLSRRKSSYQLAGLSFREYLEFNNIANFPIIDIEQLLTNHNPFTNNIADNIKILPHFSNYLANGYYPFYNEAVDTFYDKLHEIVNVILETDIPAVSDIIFESSLKLKTLLSLLTDTVPYTPNLSKLATKLNISDSRTLIKYLNYLDKAELINALSTKAQGNQLLNKPDKIYLNNTNLMYSFTRNDINKGTLRETFAYNQLKYQYKISYPKQGDFYVDQKYTIEIGGKNKTKNQIRNLKNAYIAMDDIETAFGNTIPLWSLGFLY